MRATSFSLLLLSLLSLNLAAQAQVLTVTDAESGRPLQQVSIISLQPSAYATTNARGQADISAFQEAQRIEFRLLGYATLYRSYAQLAADSFLVALAPSGLEIDEVVVSATRWRQEASNIPSRISTITREQVALQNPQTAADLLAISGKVFIQKSQQGGGSPMIRGFATNRLLYAVDGVRMNTAIFRGGNIQNVISLDAFATEQAEVFFGPGSIIYGSDAIGGVMSFQTLTPQFSATDEPLISGTGVARYATANNERTGHLDVKLGWRRWALVTSISANQFDDLRMGSHGPGSYRMPFYVQRQDSMDVVITNPDPLVQRPSAYSQVNFMQKVRFRPAQAWDLTYALHYSETSPYGRYDRHLRTRGGLPRYAEWNYGPQKWAMNHLYIQHKAPNALFDNATLRLAHQFFEESRISRDLNDPQRQTRLEQVQAYSANLDFIKNLGRHKLYYGLEAVLNDVHSTGTDEDIETGSLQDGPSRYPQATWSSYGIYLMDEYRPTDRFTLQGGLRYSAFAIDATFDTRFFPFPFTQASLNEGSFTGSLGFVYRPTKRWVLSANAATAFRAPNVDDIGKVFDSEPGAVTVPNPALGAEYAYNLDVDIAHIFGEWLKVDLTAYYTYLDGALVRRNFTLAGQDSIVYDGTLSQVQAIQNAARATVYGLQAGVEIILVNGFSLASDINLQTGEEEQDDGTTSPSRHAAPWFGTTRLTYKTTGLQLQLYATYSGERRFEDLPITEQAKPEIYAIDANGNPYSPSWYTLNFKALVRLDEQLTLTAGLENITDQRYRPYSSGIAAPGRNFILALRASF